MDTNILTRYREKVKGIGLYKFVSVGKFLRQMGGFLRGMYAHDIANNQ